ncbi:DedA family protein [uncultured Sphingomonas sp.]|uniref:DedA family protein n=1 Tax=uncultured Sphingomonas sp. TaxID=158754 RepID=UPI00261A94E9|nr:DedA family protein [uncultured Sphingomonas sp.]
MTIEAIVAKYGLVALFLGAGLEGETVVVAGGILAHRGLFPLVGAMAAAAAGSFVIDQLWFLLGRRFHDHRFVRKAYEKPAFAKALGFLQRHPIGFIFAFRFIYGFRTVSPIAIGTTDVPARLFMIVNLVSAIVWGIIFSGLGFIFGRGFEQLLGRLEPDTHVLLMLLGAVIVATGAYFGYRYWRKA